MAAYIIRRLLLMIPTLFGIILINFLIVQIAQYASKDLDIIARTPWYVRSAFYTACFYAFVVAGEFGGGQFIYFQF